MKHKHRTVEDVHGKDGMGDSFFEKAVQSPAEGHAVDFLIETVHKNPGEIHLIGDCTINEYCNGD